MPSSIEHIYFLPTNAALRGVHRLPQTLGTRTGDGEMQSLWTVLPPDLDASQVCAAKGFASQFISRVDGCAEADRPQEPAIPVKFRNPSALQSLECGVT